MQSDQTIDDKTEHHPDPIKTMNLDLSGDEGHCTSDPFRSKNALRVLSGGMETEKDRERYREKKSAELRAKIHVMFPYGGWAGRGVLKLDGNYRLAVSMAKEKFLGACSVIIRYMAGPRY